MIDSFSAGQMDVPLLFSDSTSVEPARQQFLDASADIEPECYGHSARAISEHPKAQ
jgi:hypothetical protein